MATLLFDQTPYEKVRQGLQRKIIHTDQLMSVLIDFSGGPWEEPEPLHSHLHEQISYIAEGEVVFFCEEEGPVKLKEGDFFAVPSGKKHGIQLISSKARLIDNFNPVREDFFK